ncbi:TonB-dependent receptor domain-containing protein [Flavobacterium caeni]|uniref:Outer membrane receptor proteins, mostly Fe transport n=1 Tax=Flavobacterium caeni TaxID=490189 RepID=A0A1G5I8Q2_9FLAO|nr:TonB-dependent receptor [Flavobacterium caeni]SCY72515.1 Outer membrane receptor proteins, mostly Fe transport [Flavobacterium caeni]
MKSLLLALAFLTAGHALAQQSPSLVWNTQTNLACETDQIQRNFTLERTDVPKTIGSYNVNGCAFKLDAPLEAGSYALTVSAMGFEAATVKFDVAADTPLPITPEPIVLREKNNALAEVTVYGNKKQFVKMEADKTIVSVKENPLLSTGSTFDAVKKLPGVIASPTGGLTLNGKGVAIYIDGAPSTLSGTDLQNYLSSLPASAIEKVELIYNPGAAYDANASGSVINIVTSTKRLKGVNASFNINYNFNKYQKPSPQILLNGKEKRLSWQTMTGYNYIEGENKGRFGQTFTSFDPPRELRQQNLQEMTWRNFYFRLGTNYKLSDRSNLLLNYNNNFGNDRAFTRSTAVSEDINFFNHTRGKNKSHLHELSLQYKTKLDTLGRTLDVTAYGTWFGKNPLSEATGADLRTATYSFNNSDLDFKMANYYLKYDFAFPFDKIGFSVNTGGKYAMTSVENNGRYNFNSNDIRIFDIPLYTDHIGFDYDESNLAFYVEARQKIKKFFFTAGLRFENFHVDREAERSSGDPVQRISFTNTNLFPTASALYQIDDDMNVSANYSRKIAQPDYNLLDPNNSANFDQYNTSQGDMTLDPTFFDNYELKFTALQFVSLGANYTVSKDNNRFVFNAQPGELVANQTAQQFEKINIFSAYLSFPIPLDYFLKGKEEFNKRMNTIDKMNYIFINTNYVKSEIKGYDNPLPNKAIVNFAMQSQIILPWDITNTMNYFILPKGTWEIYRIDKAIQQFDVSFNKDFLNKNLKIGLHCFDVFNANEVNALIAARNLNTNFYQKADSRHFRVSLTWNFGNLKLEKDNTNIDTERKSQGGGLLK